MTDIKDVECKYCGSVLKLRKDIQMNPKTGEYKYACPHCAKKWE